MSTIAAHAVAAKRDATRAAAAAAMWTPRHIHLTHHISSADAAVVMNEHARAAPERLPLWAILNLNCRYHIHWKTWIQVLICIIHPLPFAEKFLPGFTIEVYTSRSLTRMCWTYPSVCPSSCGYGSLYYVGYHNSWRY